MTTYTFTTPQTVGSLGNQITVSSLELTGFWFTSTPALGALGTGGLELTLTDPSSGWQETVTYSDASVLSFWASVPSVSSGELGDVVAQAVFAKLVADGKLPAGTVSVTVASTTSTTDDTTSTTSTSTDTTTAEATTGSAS